jgi:hypothetical protein
MELDLTITPHEAAIVKLWSEKTISGGHWGDGDAVFPDEAHALEKLKKTALGTPQKYTARDVEIMLIWMEHCCGGLFASGFSLTAEESQLVKKLKSVMPLEDM